MNKNKSVEEIYDSIGRYIGYLQKEKVTPKQTQMMLFSLLIQYDTIPPTKKEKGTKKICNIILGNDKNKKRM